jgi:hypothetical protein
MIALFDAKINSVFDKINFVENLARRKFITAFILSLIKSKKVQFSELAFHLNPKVKTASNFRRIQSFFQHFLFDYDKIALLLACFILNGKVKICIDRTEWDFGLCQVNILAVTVFCKGVGIPLYFHLLDNKSGNSKTENRIDLLAKTIKLLGRERIECVIGDREFIGEKWYKYLLVNEINFYFRIPKSTLLEVNGIKKRAGDFIENRSGSPLDNVKVGDFYLSVAMKKMETDFLIVLTNTFAHQALFIYRKRWSIEVFFQSIKKRGFDLESSHLQDLSKLKKLFALVCIAYSLCLQTGIEHNEKVQKIRLQKNGYKVHSFFRNGLDILRKALIDSQEESFLRFHQYINRLRRMVLLQLIRNQTFIKIIV